MKKIFSLIIFFLCINALFSQTRLSYKGSGNYTLRERTDLRQYNNGKYIGLVRREVTSFITPVSFENGYKYEGNFFLQQETVHAAQEVGFGIRNSIPSAFKIDREGKLTMLEDNGYPSFRSFPSFPEKQIKIGDSWQGKAERAVDPFNKGIVTKMPIYVQYKYTGDEYLNNEPVYVLSAQWATRYGTGSGTSYIDWGGDKELEKAIGSHKATVYVSKITGNALLIRDTVDETFYYSGENVIQFKGTISLFTEYPPAVDRSKLVPALKRICELTDDEADEILNTPDTNSQIAMLNSVDSDALVSEITDVLSDSNKNEKLSPSKTNGNTISGELVNQEDFTSDLTKADGNTSWTPIDADLKTEKQQKTTEADSNKAKEEKLEALTKKVLAFAENNKKEATNKTKIAVDTTPAGIRLSIQDLQFKANSSELLPGEASRLDQIAEVLKTVDSQLLVEGHTASVGNPKGEQELSIERSQAIAKALTQRGINPGRFICKGFGGTKPIADNSTPQGKARNRRVEITILD